MFFFIAYKDKIKKHPNPLQLTDYDILKINNKFQSLNINYCLYLSLLTYH